MNRTTGAAVTLVLLLIMLPLLVLGTSLAALGEAAMATAGPDGGAPPSSTVSPASDAPTASAPTSPKTLLATGGDARIYLTWSPPAQDHGSPVTNYKIYRSNSPSNEVFLIMIGNYLNYTDLGLTNGQIYYYTVTAVNALGESIYSNEASARPATVPSAPQSLITIAGDAQVSLSWTAPSSDGGSAITNYTIYRGTSSGGEVFLVKVGNVNSYLDTGLTNGQTYYYLVRAVNAKGEGAPSNEASATPTAAPSPPLGLVATPGIAQIGLNWSAPSSQGGSLITGYRIYRGTAPGAESLLTTVGDVRSYTDPGLTAGQAYYYVVSAVNSAGEGPPSNEASATPMGPPAQPSNLAATAGNAQITLTWEAPVNNGGSPVLHYVLYRGSSPGGETYLTTLGNVLSYDDTGLVNGQTYYYKMSAVNSVGEGALSNEASATPASLPSEPRSLVTSVGDSRTTLNWMAPSNDGGSPITGYRVYRGVTSGGEVLLTTLGNVLTYTDLGLTNGQTYYYKVGAMNANGEGPLSLEVSARPISVPGAPILVSATPGDQQVVLVWTAPASDGGSAVTNYQVLRGTVAGGESPLVTLGNALNYTDPGLSNGQVYYYKIAAVNSIGTGPPSNELNAKPAGPPGAPQSLHAASGDAYVNLTWVAPLTDGGSPITNYQVWRGLASGTEVLLANAGLRLWYNDTGLTNGQTYYYKVHAENAKGIGPTSSEVSATPLKTSLPPSAPQNLVATAGNSQVVLSWSAPSTDGGSPVTGYRLYRGTSSGGESLLQSLGNVLSYTDPGLTNGQTYYYKVSATNSVGESPQSNEALAIPATVPGPPSGLTASPGNAQASLSWTAPVSDGGSVITGYKVYRGTTSGGESLLASLGSVLTYSDATVANGQTYYYKVSAVNAKGEGGLSNEAMVVPRTVPSAPQSLAATAGNAQATLNWLAPSSNGGDLITNYRIYRGTAPGGEALLTTVGNVLTFADSGLTNGQPYYYKVSAVNGAGEGARSNEASATPTTVPSAPRGLTAAAGNAQIALNWTVPSSNGGGTITGYRIYRGTSSGGESLIASIGASLSYVDGGLINGQMYYYKVSAVNPVGEGLLSNEAFASPLAVPSAPRNLTTTPGNGQVVLSWEAPSSDGGSPVTGYSLFRGEASGSEMLLVTLGEALEHVDTGLTNGLTYYYYVKAANSLGLGLASEEAWATPSSLPSAPINVNATPGGAEVRLTWDAPSSDGGLAIASYNIYRGTSPGGEVMLTTIGNVLTYIDTGLANGQTYYYRVSASNPNGEGEPSDEVSATPRSVPSAPLLLNAAPGNSFINLTWISPASDGGRPILNYTIYRGTAAGEETSFAVIGSALYYVDTGLTNGQTYYYTVSASNDVGEGLQSAEVSATPATFPSAPEGLTALAGDTEVSLTWMAPPSDGGSPVFGYRVYRGNSSGNESLLTELGLLLSFLDQGLTKGQTYYYMVSAINDVGEGARSNETSATPATVPSAPQNLTASTDNGAVHLSWLAPEDDGGSTITNYNIYRGNSSGQESLLTVIGAELEFTDSGLAVGQQYFYQVRAVNALGEGVASSEVQVTFCSVPSAPQGLSVSIGDARIELSWAGPVSDGGSPITNYSIYRGVSPGEESLLVSLGQVLVYLDEGLTNGQTHYYRISATNAFGEGPLSGEVQGTPGTTPSPPENLRAASADSKVVLTWSAPESDGGSPITGYRIFRGTTSGSEDLLGEVGDVLTYVDDAVEIDRPYYYMVSGRNSLGEGQMSNEVQAIPSTVPSAPLGLQAVAGDRSADLNWTSPSYLGLGPIFYHLFRGGSEIWNGTDTSFHDSPLAKGRLFSYEIAAENSIGMGSRGEAVEAEPFGVPDSPWGLEVIQGNGNVSLSWRQVNYSGPGPLSYSVYRDGWRIWSGGATSCLDRAVQNGHSYLYSVSACNAVGWSGNSSAMSASPQGPPTTPRGLHAQASPGSVRLNWSAPAYCGPGSINYLVFRDGNLIWGGEGLDYEDTGLDENGVHYYTVAAYNPIGQGEQSAGVQVTAISAQVQPPPYWVLVTFLGLAGIAIIPLSMLAFRAYRSHYIRSVSMLPNMRCPNCGTIISATVPTCPMCGVRFTVRKIIKGKH